MTFPLPLYPGANAAANSSSGISALPSGPPLPNSFSISPKISFCSALFPPTNCLIVASLVMSEYVFFNFNDSITRNVSKGVTETSFTLLEAAGRAGRAGAACTACTVCTACTAGTVTVVSVFIACGCWVACAAAAACCSSACCCAYTSSATVFASGPLSSNKYAMSSASPLMNWQFTPLVPALDKVRLAMLDNVGTGPTSMILLMATWSTVKKNR